MSLIDTSKDLCISFDTELNFHVHIRSIVGKSSGKSVYLLNSTVCCSREFMWTLHISHIRPLIEFGSCVWNLVCISVMKLLKIVRRQWTKWIDGFENITYSHRMKNIDLFSVEGNLRELTSSNAGIKIKMELIKIITLRVFCYFCLFKFHSIKLNICLVYLLFICFIYNNWVIELHVSMR